MKSALFITGVPGTGKSTQTERLITFLGVQNVVVIHIDQHRIDTPGKDPFSVVDKMLADAIEMNKNIVYDGLGISTWVKDNIISRLQCAGYHILYILFWTTPEQAHRQRMKRKKQKWVPVKRVCMLEIRTPCDFFCVSKKLSNLQKSVIIFNSPYAELQLVATFTNTSMIMSTPWTFDTFLGCARFPKKVYNAAMELVNSFPRISQIDSSTRVNAYKYIKKHVNAGD